MAETRTEKLVRECKRQEESCLYTSTTLYVWLREARWWKGAFIVVPILLGGIASWSVLDRPDWPLAVWTTAIAGLVAGLMPAIRDALDLDLHIDEIAKHAAQFKNLQDRFRVLGETAHTKTDDVVEAEVRELLDRLDDARKASVTPPERCFVAARNKIKEGHYAFSVDGSNG